MTSMHNYETRARGAHFDLIFFPVDFLCCSEFVTFVAGLGGKVFPLRFEFMMMFSAWPKADWVRMYADEMELVDHGNDPNLFDLF